jgi:hypothetical protein
MLSSSSTTKKVFSGLQKEVLSLYRVLLREAAKKDKTGTSSSSSIMELWKNPQTTASYARTEFRRQAHQLAKKDFRTIEFKIRHGQKQLKLLQMPGVKKGGMIVSGTSTSASA